MKQRIISIVLLSLIIVALGVIVSIRKKSGERNVFSKDTACEASGADSARIAERIFNLIILDESGSMSGLEEVSVSGVNETLQTIRAAAEEFPQQKQIVTFATFEGEPSRLDNDSFCKIKRNRQVINEVKDFTLSEYKPSGLTPLWDTMGLLLCDLEEYVTEKDLVLVTVITDGMENSSCKYDSEKIRTLVKRLDEKGWIFTYIGANQNVALVAGDMGIRNYYQYSSDVEGTRNMFKKDRGARAKFYRNARIGTQYNRFQEGYFDDDDNE